ncbi:MAG: pyridoxamine 5'-phosphate oxidase family protein [Actinomycetota bacterium]|jgi:uncharacterized protein
MSADEDPRPDDGTTLAELTRDECLELLGGRMIGRVAVAEPGAAPLVVPVNYVLEGESVVFRTDYGSKFRLAVLGEQPVAFEIDGVEPGRRTGWSVLVQGTAHELDEAAGEALGVEPWAPGRKDRWVRIVPSSLTGRRIQLPPVSGTDSRGYL